MTQLTLPTTARPSVQTRNAAWAKLQKNLSKHRWMVYRIVVEEASWFGGSMTDLEIAGCLGWTINRVTGRVKELRDLGLFGAAPKKPQGENRVRASIALPPEDALVVLVNLLRAA